MRTVKLTQKRTLNEIIGKRLKQDTLVERDGRAVAMIVPFDDDDRYWYELEHTRAFAKAMEKAKKQVKQGKTVSHEDLKKRLGIH